LRSFRPPLKSVRLSQLDYEALAALALVTAYSPPARWQLVHVSPTHQFSCIARTSENEDDLRLTGGPSILRAERSRFPLGAERSRVGQRFPDGCETSASPAPAPRGPALCLGNGGASLVDGLPPTLTFRHEARRGSLHRGLVAWPIMKEAPAPRGRMCRGLSGSSMPKRRFGVFAPAT
jgi:hypothetical protein